MQMKAISKPELTFADIILIFYPHEMDFLESPPPH